MSHTAREVCTCTSEPSLFGSLERPDMLLARTKVAGSIKNHGGGKRCNCSKTTATHVSSSSSTQCTSAETVLSGSSVQLQKVEKPQPSFTDQLGHQWYVVEEVLSSQTRRGKLQYFIKLGGYDQSTCKVHDFLLDKARRLIFPLQTFLTCVVV